MSYKVLLIFVLFNFFLINLDYAYTNPDNEVILGLEKVYNLRFDEAEIIFKDVQRKYPADLKGYFFQSLIYFYKALAERNESMLDTYSELSENVIEMAEDILEKDERNAEALYFKGVSHSYRSLLLLNLNKSLLKAASDGNEGYRILNALVKMKPDYYDAYMGLGLYKIALGFVPEKFKWLLSLIGFDGNIHEGISYLYKSMSRGKFTKTDSKVFLCLFSIKEKETGDNRSAVFARELCDEFPQSAVFKILHSGMLLQSGDNYGCIKASEEALKLNNYSFKNEILKSANVLIGTALFRENEFSNSIKYYEEGIKLMNNEDRFNVHIFTLATAYELSGNRTKALDVYSKVRSDFINERDGEAEKLFYRYARNKIKTPITDIEKADIKIMNLRESLQFDEALDVFNEAVSENIIQNASPDDKLRIYFNTGLVYVYKNEPDKAISMFEKCLSIKPENEIWILPHSYFELGKIYSRKGNSAKSSEMFDEIFSFDDYDFRYFLEMRLANFLYNKN